MRKQAFTYLLGIFTLLMGSCVESEVLIDSPEITKGQVTPISFAGSFVDNSATRHTNKLCSHLSTMGVWGWRNGMLDKNTCVYDNQLVCYNSDSARWEYSPLQYWRKDSQYEFCAYAPHQHGTPSEVSIDNTSHMITINNVTLHGCNLQDTPTPQTLEQFSGTTDTDWMVARAGQTAIGAAGMDVEFMMQHILGKLDIRIKVCPDLLKRPHIDHITADSINVGKLPSHGNFTQQLTHTPIISKPEEATINEWKAYSTDLDIKGTHECTLASTPTYIVESLVIPHYIQAESNIELYYSYHYADGHKEQCRYCMPLDEAFTRFVSGYTHTLTFTVCSTRIDFEAGANDWEINTSN